MKRSHPIVSLLCLCAALAVMPLPAFAQANNIANAAKQDNNAAEQNNPDTWSPRQAANIVKQVRSKLLSLPDYNVFDSLRFAIKGKTIVLEGYASLPVLKEDAANAVKSIEGVESVDNEIKILPPSPTDDRIRMEVYRRIYTQPMLRKYTNAPPGFGRGPSVAYEAGGITQDPPLGYHAIHIIVDNGRVILTGVVDSQSDADVAAIQANSTPGVFSVDNDLRIAGGGKQSPKQAGKSH